MLGAIGMADRVGSLKPIAAVGLLSFLCLIWFCRASWTPRTSFGWANGITALRLALVLFTAYGLRMAPGRALAALVLGILLLDGVDGWLARRTGSASTFGAHFDMETDALLILVITQELWQRGTLGIWILTSGLLRYVYVLCQAVLPKRSLSMPPSRFGRAAFSTLTIGLALAFFFPNVFGAIAACAGTLMVGISFARSFYWTWLSTTSVKRGT